MPIVSRSQRWCRHSSKGGKCGTDVVNQYGANNDICVCPMKDPTQVRRNEDLSVRHGNRAFFFDYLRVKVRSDQDFNRQIVGFIWRVSEGQVTNGPSVRNTLHGWMW